MPPHLIAGKSVSVPQWVYDSSHPNNKVAVLLRRVASAEGLAQHVSQLRGCAVGQEIGLGIAGRADMSEASRIVFMTYGFFNTISAADATLSSWSAVIMDDAHERKADADAIFARLTAACKARADFKMVVMSAFIAPSLFTGSLKKQGVTTDVLEVPGVVFPIKDEWFCDDSWDPTSAGAIQSLALECVRVYLQACCQAPKMTNVATTAMLLLCVCKRTHFHDCVPQLDPFVQFCTHVAHRLHGLLLHRQSSLTVYCSTTSATTPQSSQA